MSETASDTGPLSFHQAVQEYQQETAEADTSVSDAARTLAKARAAKRAAPEVEGDPAAEDLEQDPEGRAATDSPEGEEDEADALQDGTEADEGESEGSQTITIGGKQLTVEEIERDWLPKSEYTRKTMDLAEQRKAFESERADALQRVNGLLQALGSQMEAEPDWEKVLAEEGYEAAFTKNLQWRKRTEGLQQAFQMARQEQARALNDLKRQARDELIETYDHDLADPGKWKEAYGQLVEYAKNEGYTQDEAESLVHARYFKTLDKARKYDELMKKQTVVQKQVKTKPKVVRTGTRPALVTKESQALKAAQARFDKQPTRENAMHLMQAEAIEQQAMARRSKATA